jgi:hypothetical protein
MAESESFVEQRYAVKFMQKEGESAANAYRRLCNVYGEGTMSRARAFEWFKRFSGGRQSTDNDNRTGRPVSALTDDNVTTVDKMIRSDYVEK